MSIPPARLLKKPVITAGMALNSLFRQFSFFDGRYAATFLGGALRPMGVATL